MIRKYHKVGLIEAVAGAPKQIEIPTTLGTITGIYLMPKNGVAAAASVAKVTASVASIQITANPKNGMAFDFVKPITPAKLYRRELYFASTFGVTNSGTVLAFDPSAALFTAESTRAYLNLGTADLAKLVVELIFAAVLDGVTGVEIWVEYDPRQSNLGAHIRLGKATQKIPATGGDIEIVHLPKSVDGSFQYQKIDIAVPANMSIDTVTVVVDSDRYELRAIPVALLERGQVEAGRKPQADVVTLDFAKEAFASFFLPGKMTDFKVIPHFVAGVGAVESQIDVDYELLYQG